MLTLTKKILTNNVSKIQKRYIKHIYVNDVVEKIYTKHDYGINKCKNILKNESLCVIGYGPQGKSQALNLKDNGFNIKLGLRYGKSWENAIEDGWVENENLFLINDAVKNSTIIQFLLSDAGQIKQWLNIEPHLTKNKTLYFSHGFALTFNKLTNINIPDNIDVIMVAPKGSGLTIRNNFLNKTGFNSSFAIHQNYTKNAFDKCMAIAFGIGNNYVFETTFKNEVYSDLTGERCVLMGLIHAAFKTQYELLRNKGHSPLEAYNETVEEALYSLYPIISEKGMGWLFKNCSTTAQRGALDWSVKFEKVLLPVMEQCYNNVINGVEAKNVIKKNNDPDYKNKLNDELFDISQHELWKVADECRNLNINDEVNVNYDDLPLFTL